MLFVSEYRHVRVDVCKYEAAAAERMENWAKMKNLNRTLLKLLDFLYVKYCPYFVSKVSHKVQ